MKWGCLSCWRKITGSKYLVCQVIFFFLLTPFLLSCGGSGTAPTTESSSPSKILTSAVKQQNQSAQDAVSDVIELARTLTEGQELIETVFGTMTPTLKEIEIWATANPDELDTLSSRLDLLSLTALEHGYQFQRAVEELIEQETIIRREMGLDGSTPERGLVGGALVVLTVLGAAAGARGRGGECNE